MDYLTALSTLAITQLLGSLYLHSLTRKVNPGLPRLLYALPVLLANLVAPRLFNRATDSTTIVLVAFNTAWLSSFKVLLWVLNRSALASRELTPSQFTAILLAPLTPVSEASAAAKRRGRIAEVEANPTRMLVDGTMKMALLGIIARMLQYPEVYPPVLRAFFCGLALYGLLSSIMDGPGALISRFLGIKVSPHFDQPWLSRWDLAAGNALRQLIYDPIVEGSLVGSPAEGIAVVEQAGGEFHEPSATDLVKKTDAGPSVAQISADTRTVSKEEATEASAEAKSTSSPAAAQSTKVTRRQIFGSAMAFLTSGLVHEGIFWYLTGHSSGGYWLSFFLVQIPVTAVERTVLAALRSRGVHIPLPILTLWAVWLECTAAAYLFFGPAEQQGLVANIVGNVDVAYGAVAQSLVHGKNVLIGRGGFPKMPVWLHSLVFKNIKIR